MDSLTQVVLGAACGELVAGRKIGNRAMLWGALGGTIPDFDVFAGFFTDEITGIAFHRGFMHSILFAVLAPWGLAWLTHRFYSTDFYRRKGYKLFFSLFWLVFYLIAAVGINLIPIILNGSFSWWTFSPTLALGIWLVRKLWLDYRKRDLASVELPYFTWVQVFFWSIFTHPLLDCFTNYGTQIWQPFADTRIQWNTVSVVDPLYTIPFALFLLVAAWLVRLSKLRYSLAWAGMLWGIGYLFYTWNHKQLVDAAVKKAIAERGWHYSRFQTNPTIFNNIVWTATVESDSVYYFGLYGFNDAPPSLRPISVISKNHSLLDHIPENDRAKRFLRWFTNGYFNVLPRGKDTFQVNDLRFGLLGDTLLVNNYVFPFLLFKNEQGEWDVLQDNKRVSDPEMNKQAMKGLWNRVIGQE